MLSPALIAQSSAGQPAIWQLLVPWILIAGIIYVLLILPQQRRQKSHQKLIGDLGPGDKIVTNGGLVGTITRIENGTLRLKLAPQTEVTVMRSHIAGKAEEESK